MFQKIQILQTKSVNRIHYLSVIWYD